MGLIFPIVLVAVWVAVTILASNDGAWGAGLICVSTLFAGLIAMNWFEPLAAGVLDSLMPPEFADFTALMLLFAGSVTGMRFLADYLAPTNIELPALVYDIGRFGFAILAGFITMCFVCTAAHTAPIPRSAIGFSPEDKMFFGAFAPDRAWLGFTQWVSERTMGSTHVFDGPTYRGIPNADPQFAGAMPARWPSFIIRYAARRERYGRGSFAARQGFVQPGQTSPGQTKPAGGGGF